MIIDLKQFTQFHFLKQDIPENRFPSVLFRINPLFINHLCKYILLFLQSLLNQITTIITH